MATYRQLSVIVKDRQGYFWMLCLTHLKPLVEEPQAQYGVAKRRFGGDGNALQIAAKTTDVSNRTLNALPLQRSQERSGLVS